MKYYFAPMEGITGYIYRQAHHRFFTGVDQYFTPFIAPAQSRKLSSREKNDLLPENNRGVPLIPQILTNRAEDFIWAAKELSGYGFREVNLNLGCPSGTVTAKYKGAGFLALPEELNRFFEQVFTGTAAAGISVSVKTRIGMASPGEFEKLLNIYNQYPIKELIIHPRVRSDFYGNRPNLEVFRYGAERSKSPVCYNGDIFTAEAYEHFREEFAQDRYSSIGSVMLGRGAVANPWLFEQISSEKESAVSRDTLQAFHDEVFNGYREIMSGDRNTLFKMKELWFYMASLFSDQGQGTKDKFVKKIKKSQKTEDYLTAVSALFDSCPIRKDRGFTAAK